MDRKGKSKMIYPDGDYADQTPGAGLPLDLLNEAAPGWDATTAAPALEQHDDSLQTVMEMAAAAAAAAALYTGEGTAMVSSSAAMAAAGELWGGIDQSMGVPAMQIFEEQRAFVEMQNKLLQREAFGMAMASVPPGAPWNNDDTLPMRTAAAAWHDGSSTAMESSSMAAAAERVGRNDRAITDQTKGLVDAIVPDKNQEIEKLEAALAQEVQARQAAEQREQQALLVIQFLEQQVEAREQLLQAAGIHRQALEHDLQAALAPPLAGNIQENMEEDTASSPAPALNTASAAAPVCNGATSPAPARDIASSAALARNGSTPQAPARDTRP